jgi:hypothetical protein
MPQHRSFTERVGGIPRGMRGFVSRLNAAALSDIFLIRAKDNTGRPAWYYFRTHRGKKRAFEVAIEKGTVQLTDYGKVLFSGYGANPPADVVERMRVEYGFDGG